MWTDDKIEALEAYAEGRMHGPERDAFEQLLQTDTDMAEQLTRYRGTRKAIAQHHEDERVRDLLRRTEALQQNTTMGWLKWVAAAVVLLGLSTTIWWFTGRTPSLPALAEEFDVKESPLPVFMSNTHDGRRDLDKGMQLFGEALYGDALREFDRLPPTDTTRFYSGLCLVGTGADPSGPFLRVAEDVTSAYRPKALYHLMIWHMEQNDREQAGKLLRDQLRMGDHPYHEQLEAIGSRSALDR